MHIYDKYLWLKSFTRTINEPLLLKVHISLEFFQTMNHLRKDLTRLTLLKILNHYM